MPRMAGRRALSARRWPSAATPGAPSASSPENRMAAAHAVGHAAALAVVGEGQRAVVLVVVDLDVWVVARLRGALVGRSHAGLGDERPRNRGTPERLARARHDGPALGQRLLGEGLPNGVGEVTAQMGEAHHRVLRPVDARPATAPSGRRQRRCARWPRRRSRSAPPARCPRRLRRRARPAGSPPAPARPALKANSMSPTAEGPLSAPSPPRKARTSRVALSVSANRPRSIDCAERRIGQRDRGNAPDRRSLSSSAIHKQALGPKAGTGPSGRRPSRTMTLRAAARRGLRSVYWPPHDD